MFTKPTLILSLLASPAAFAATTAIPSSDEALPEVVVTGKAEDLVGVASSATVGRASAEEIARRPYVRRSEILETVPGLAVTQHAGGGKATQYFLRGFNLDHGTDFAVSIDRTPINMRTHAHGQGYTDLNGLIPELVEGLEYVKGTYSAKNGDLSTAGSANFKLYNVLPQGIASAEIGEHGYYRSLLADSLTLGGGGNLTWAGEYNTYDGPWLRSEDFQRFNGFLRYHKGDDDTYFSLTAMGYRGRWNSSDQIPQRAVKSGLISPFGNLDDTTGGKSHRYSLSADWQAKEGDTTTRVTAYAVNYGLDLFSNFTYFLDDAERGDQFEQKEGRWQMGGEISKTYENQTFAGHEAEYAWGLQTRHDVIGDIGLYKTEQRKRHTTVREDDIYEGSVGLYGEGLVKWTPWFRTQLGVRADAFYFDTAGTESANAGDEVAGIISPKLSAIFGPWDTTELYVNFGTGFHSNDARGVTTRKDPVSGDRVPGVDPLVRTMGGEIGIRTELLPGLTTSLAGWWLDSASELVYVGDAGTNEAGPGSRRYGVELTSYYRPNDWLAIDAELAVTHARLRGTGAEDRIPNSIPVMASGGITVGEAEGPFASLRARAFTARPLEESGKTEGKDSITINGQLGYRKKDWEVAVECLNLFDTDNNDIEYFYESRLQGESATGRADTHFHPAEPRMFRLRVTYRF